MQLKEIRGIISAALLLFFSVAVTAKPAVISYPERGIETTVLNQILDNGQNESLNNVWQVTSSHNVAIALNSESNTREFVIENIKGSPVVLSLQLPDWLELANYPQLVARLSASSNLKFCFALADDEGNSWQSKHKKLITTENKQIGTKIKAKHFKVNKNKKLNFNDITKIQLLLYPPKNIKDASTSDAGLTLNLQDLSLLGAAFFDLPPREALTLLNKGQAVDAEISFSGIVSSKIVTANIYESLKLEIAPTASASLTITALNNASLDLTDLEQITAIMKAAKPGAFYYSLIDKNNQSWNSPVMSIDTDWQYASAEYSLFSTDSKKQTLNLADLKAIKLSFAASETANSIELAQVLAESNWLNIQTTVKDANLALRIKTPVRLVSTADAQVVLADELSTKNYDTIITAQSGFKWQGELAKLQKNGLSTPYLSINKLSHPRLKLTGTSLTNPQSLATAVAEAGAYKNVIEKMIAAFIRPQAEGDTIKPEVAQILVDNKEFYNGDFVGSNKPLVTVKLTDNVGVVSYNIQIKNKADNSVVLSTSNIISATTNITVSQNATQVLTPGEYELTILASDAANNTVSDIHGLAVAAGLEITSALAGPNPFNPNQQNVRIQYQLSQAADVTAYIYSRSGEKLYETQIAAGTANGASTGFNYISWDGRNRWGEVVASDIYIAYIIADDGSNKVHKKVKVAVLK